jgi:hypothetical protein
MFSKFSWECFRFSTRLGSARLGSAQVGRSARYSLQESTNVLPGNHISSPPSLILKVNNLVERERDKG